MEIYHDVGIQSVLQIKWKYIYINEYLKTFLATWTVLLNYPKLQQSGVPCFHWRLATKPNLATYTSHESCDLSWFYGV